MADFGREPDPDWKELSVEDKIERLAREVLDQDRLLYQLTIYLGLLVDHDHMGGQIVQPINKPESQKKFWHHGMFLKNWLD